MAPEQRVQRIDRIVAEALAVLGAGRQVVPFSSRYPEFDLPDAYAVAAQVCAMRKARGESPVGRKIGFTNRAVWSGYGISGPIWNYMFDTTVADLASVGGTYPLGGFTEPRIEPEIALHLARAPNERMSEDELIGCVDWIAHGFEIVYSIFPGWAFTAADAVAAYGVHAALLLGDKHPISGNPGKWKRDLAGFTVTLAGSDGVTKSGHARNVLGGPVKALQFLAQELARHPQGAPLGAGEIVTTGTLTEAMPVAAGQTWSTEFEGTDIEGIRLRFR